MARLSLYEKIYLHKKVRAAESFLKKKLTEFVTYAPEYQQAHKWLYLPESIIEEKLPFTIEKEEIVEGELFPRPKTIQENVKFSDIIERKIPDRAFGFGPANSKTDSAVKNEKGELLSKNELDKIHSIALWKALMGNTKTVESLKKEILKEAENISKYILEKKLDFEDFIINDDNDRTIITETLVFDIPNWERVKLNPQTLYFKDAGFNTINWTIPVDKIHTYYQLHRILAYVYVNYKYCPLIYLAAEKVLYKYKEKDSGLSNFVFDQTQAVSGRVHKNAEKIKQELSKIGYYDSYEDLIPLDDSLTTSFAIEKIDSVVKLLGRIECRKNRNISKLDVERFLKQFDTTIQLPILHLISNIKVLSPEDELPNAIKTIRENDIGKDKKIGVFPLGDFMNSSSHILKNLKDTLEENNITSFNVNDKIIKNLEYILFVDDNINTGIQCLNIMMKYLGYDKTKIADEKKQKELWMDLQNKKGDVQEGIEVEFSEELKKKKLEFVFIVGHETSKNELTNYLKTYCDLNQSNFNITIIHTLRDNDRILSSGYGGYSENSIFGDIKNNFDKNVTKRDETQKMLNVLREVGTALVKKKNIVTKHKQKPEDNALGYRNRENLVVFTNSIPTMTYTALWCDGKYNNKVWYPLIPRK
ncbi:MAG: hypothetical protein LBU51_09460 [Bacteroidales bacterium]|jgi:hypothetical protein|nr:hypothetical protein [Bacteroidales bacterium]